MQNCSKLQLRKRDDIQKRTPIYITLTTKKKRKACVYLTQTHNHLLVITIPPMIWEWEFNIYIGGLNVKIERLHE